MMVSAGGSDAVRKREPPNLRVSVGTSSVCIVGKGPVAETKWIESND